MLISPQQLQRDLDFWIEGDNHRERHHSTNGYLCPIDEQINQQAWRASACGELDAAALTGAEPVHPLGIHQPPFFARASYVIRRPWRLWYQAIWRRCRLSLVSSISITLPPWRWVLRSWPTSLLANPQPEHGEQGLNRPSASFRAQTFPVAPKGAAHGATRPLSIAFSSSAFARSLLRGAFSYFN